MVHGYCARRFAAVRDAFAASFAVRGELGAAVHVMVAGEPVVDLFGGFADRARERPWQEDTLANAYSVGKPMVALLLLQLVAEGRVGLDDLVAAVWPAFASHGKEGATLRHALCHRAGVPAIREPLANDDLWDFDRMCAALAATAPWWVPGARHAYHTNTYGHLVGGIVRALTGELPGTRLAAQARAIGADLHVGLAGEHHGRCAEIVFEAPEVTDSFEELVAVADPDARMTLLGYRNPPGYSSMGVVNTPAWRRAQIPSTNLHATASGIARWYEAVRRGDLLPDPLRAQAVTAQSTGFCPTLGQEVTFGLGFQPWTEKRPFGRTPGSYGHFGTGGALGFADPSARIAMGYVMNHVVPRWQSPRNRALVDSVYASL